MTMSVRSVSGRELVCVCDDMNARFVQHCQMLEHARADTCAQLGVAAFRMVCALIGACVHATVCGMYMVVAVAALVYSGLHYLGAGLRCMYTRS